MPASEKNHAEGLHLVSTLTREAGLTAPDRFTGDGVEAIGAAGIFRLRAVLVGTVAFQTYAGHLGVRLPGASLQTGDADFAQHYSISSSKGMDKSKRVRIRCSAATESGICADPKTFYLDTVETAVLNGLTAELRHPEVIAQYVQTYHEDRYRCQAHPFGATA